MLRFLIRFRRILIFCCAVGACTHPTFSGVEKLHGATVYAHDLRAGAALVIAGLAAEGVTYVEHIHFIERGYEHIIRKLRELGADIRKIEE